MKCWPGPNQVGIVGTNASGRREVTFGLHLMISNPGDFATGAGSAYSQYIEDQAQSSVDLVVKGMPWMLNTYVCGASIGVDPLALTTMVADHMRGEPDGQLPISPSPVWKHGSRDIHGRPIPGCRRSIAPDCWMP